MDAHGVVTLDPVQDSSRPSAGLSRGKGHAMPSEQVIRDRVFEVKKVRPAYQQVADQLRELILCGELAPGDRLPSEVELASDFGVSRSTVREALRALASRDLLLTLRGTAGGTFVARVQGSQVSDYLETSIGLMSGDQLSVEDILEAREILEVPAAGLAARRRTDEHLRALDEALAREGQRVGEHGFREHRQFHRVVVSAAGNGLLDVMTEPVFGVLQGRFLRTGLGEALWQEIQHDHREIARFVAGGDVTGAESAMRAHLQRLRGAYVS